MINRNISIPSEKNKMYFIMTDIKVHEFLKRWKHIWDKIDASNILSYDNQNLSNFLREKINPCFLILHLPPKSNDIDRSVSHFVVNVLLADSCRVSRQCIYKYSHFFLHSKKLLGLFHQQYMRLLNVVSYLILKWFLLLFRLWICRYVENSII